jgi:hypothetical protein
MFTYLTILGMLLLVLSPLLVPLVVTAGHAITRLGQNYRPQRSAVSEAAA